MKRSELTVGAELAHIRYASEEPRKAIVVAVEPYERSVYNNKIQPCRKGNGVLVKLAREYDDSEYKDVVQLRSLVGPWADVKAAYDEEKARKKVERERHQNEVEAADERANVVLTKLAKAGVIATSKRARWEYVEPQIALSLADAERVVEILARFNELAEWPS